MILPPNETARFSFRLGRVVDAHLENAKVGHDLTVHWLELYKGTDQYTGMFRDLGKI